MARTPNNQGFSRYQSTLKPIVLGARGGQNLSAQAYPGSGAVNYITPNAGQARTLSNTGGSRLATSARNNADAWNALLAAYQGNGAQSYYDQMKAMAQGAYDRGMAALNDAYGQYISSLDANLGTTKDQLLDSYNRSKKSIQDDAARSLKQAYINKMKSERNIEQEMSAQGLSGGATESTRAGMINNYGNARNEINTTTNNNLSALEGDYNDNLAQAMQAYNTAVANAQLQKAQQAIQLENALANNQIAALQDFQSLMADDNANYLGLLEKAIAKGVDFSFTPTEANNVVNALEFQQAPVEGANKTGNNILAALQEIMRQNNNKAATNPALVNNYLAAILNQLKGVA